MAHVLADSHTGCIIACHLQIVGLRWQSESSHLSGYDKAGISALASDDQCTAPETMRSMVPKTMRPCVTTEFFEWKEKTA